MQLGVSVDHRVTPTARAASAVAGLSVYEFDCDRLRVAIPTPESHLVVRFGAPGTQGLDVHAIGAQQRARRKLIRRGQRAVMARLHLGAHDAVLGVPASALAGRTIELEALWGGAAARRLVEQLASAPDIVTATRILESAIAERVATAGKRAAGQGLALDAAARLTTGTVNAVAADLGVSDRHLRRVFREAVGLSPKTFAKLSRFHRALRSAYAEAHVSWASIAAAAGYYDQAHLIAEFRIIAGATPQALLSELRGDVAARP